MNMCHLDSPNGPFGCWVRIWVLVQFGLLCFRIFELGIVLRRIFNPFSRYLGLQSDNCLIDKYSQKKKKDLIIHNLCYLIIHFIPMQAGLFLTISNNQSQNYLINLNCLTNQNWFILIMHDRLHPNKMHADRANLIMWYLSIRWSDLETSWPLESQDYFYDMQWMN